MDRSNSVPHWTFDATAILWQLLLLYAVAVGVLGIIGLLCEMMRRER